MGTSRKASGWFAPGSQRKRKWVGGKPSVNCPESVASSCAKASFVKSKLKNTHKNSRIKLEYVFM